MKILWIEDFGKITDSFSAVQSCFQDSLGESLLAKWDRDEIDIQRDPKALLNFCRDHQAWHEVMLCRDYHGFAEIIAGVDLLQDIDVVLVDINLSNRVDKDKEIPPAYKHEEGGFYIYNELLRKGFPEDNICFLTGEENTLKAFLEQCQKLSMPEPLHSYEKNDTGYAKLRAWLKEKQSNPYLTLRRGIIEGCRHILSQLDSRPVDEVIRFHQFLETKQASEIVTDMQDYLRILQNFLPLRQPDQQQLGYLYKLFVRTLAHEWEAAKPALVQDAENEPLQAFGWIMKNVRNWSAHKNLFANLSEKEVAFLCLINLRSMFQLDSADLWPFEKGLLGLFDKPLSKETLSDLLDQKRLNLAKTYASLKKKVTSDKEDAVTFVGMLNNLVNSDKISSQEISSRLFQMFWHGLSRAMVNKAHSSIQKVTVEYTFQRHFYGKKNPESFLFQVAQHIYEKSKLDG
jgi:hypothetical protein